MDTEQIITKAAGILAHEVPPGSQVVLFGSQARGDARAHSDIDFLVIEPRVENRFRETNRLLRKLVGMHVPMDLIVLSREAFDDWRDVPGTLAYEVAREGKVLHEVVQ